jgi:hypothetical protein
MIQKIYFDFQKPLTLSMYVLIIVSFKMTAHIDEYDLSTVFLDFKFSVQCIKKSLPLKSCQMKNIQPF